MSVTSVDNDYKPVDGGDIGVHQLFSPPPLRNDEARPLQHRDVLLHRRKAHADR